MPFSSARESFGQFYAPNFEKVKWHIALGFSIRPSLCYKFKIRFYNFIDVFLIKNN